MWKITLFLATFAMLWGCNSDRRDRDEDRRRENEPVQGERRMKAGDTDRDRGYYDSNGVWHERTDGHDGHDGNGYYDSNGVWHEQTDGHDGEGYYDGNGVWHERDSGNNPPSDESRSDLAVGPNDPTSFTREAARGNKAEIELGHLAIRKADDPRVKDFGRRMVEDHGKAEKDLKEVAHKEKISLPKELSAQAKTEKDDLSRLRGSDFDRRYVEIMLRDHRQTVQMFERQAGDSSNERVRAFAERTLPTLREHLRQVENLARELGVMAG